MDRLQWSSIHLADEEDFVHSAHTIKLYDGPDKVSETIYWFVFVLYGNFIYVVTILICHQIKVKVPQNTKWNVTYKYWNDQSVL